MKEKKLAIINLISLIFVFIFNYLTGTGLINNLSQKQISDMFPTALTPSPFAFSIWGVIYTLIAIAILLMLFRNKEREYNDTVNAISYWFLVSSIANVLWTISFAYLQIALSTVLIFILLISLIMIIKNLSKLTSSLKPIFSLAFGMYAGWVLIATVLNVSVTLVQLKWNGLGLSDTIWANIILLVSLLIVALVTFNTKNMIIPLPVSWAYYAIYNKDGYLIAIIGMILLLALSLYQGYKNRYKLQV